MRKKLRVASFLLGLLLLMNSVVVCAETNVVENEELSEYTITLAEDLDGIMDEIFVQENTTGEG